MIIEKDKIKQVQRLKVNSVLDNKRTASEQSHYPRPGHQRKFTIDYVEPKKSMKQPSMQRKNRSLPRTLMQGHNSNIRSRKFLCTSETANDIATSVSNKTTIKQQEDSPQLLSLNRAVNLVQLKRYEQAINVLQSITSRELQAKKYYNLGLCCWHMGDKKKAALYFSSIMDQSFPLQQQIYTYLCTFYESSKNLNCALKTVSQWLYAFPNSKAFLIRARIYYQFKQYQKCISDYKNCYTLEPSHLEAYIQQAQAVYRQSGLDAALTKYNQLLVNYHTIWPSSQHSDINYVKYKKSLLLIHQKKYEQSLSLLAQVNNPELQSQIWYYLGIVYSIIGQVEQALLAFAKSVQANTSDKFVAQSHYQKFVILFKRNCFYDIQHQLDIIQGKYLGNEGLDTMRKVVQGIIYVLKMNFQDGIKVLEALPSNSHYIKTGKIYQHTVLSFKIFAYYSLHQFVQALQQCNNPLFKNKKPSESNLYNLTMLRAIKSANQKQYSSALHLLDQAQKIQNFNTHTLMVKAVVQILFYNSLRMASESEQQVDEQVLLSAQEILNRCLLKQPQNDQILYVLAAINYELRQYESGLKLIRKAIQVSDDHTIKHYYLKANLKLMLSMPIQAISDYSNAIVVMNEQQESNNEQQQTEQEPIMECYLERAKCWILEGSHDKAEADLRTFFSHVENVKEYKQQMELFMHVGCSHVILDIYKKILDQEYDHYGKIKCYYLAKQLNNCLVEMNRMLQFNGEDEDGESQYDLEKLSIDRDCLDALKKSSLNSDIMFEDALKTFQQKLLEHSEGDIFKKSDCIFYAGVMAFQIKNYSKAKNYFIDAKGQKILQNQLINNSEADEDNQIFSMQQINYNIGICDLVQGKWSPYLDGYPVFKRQFSSSTINLLQQFQEITPFQVKNRLCSIYPPIKWGCISYRLSFCLPKIKLRQIKFNPNSQLLKSITLSDIDMRPSAPWINKNKKGIIFTSDVLKDSIDLKSQKSKKGGNGKKKAQQRYKEHE